jgi:hypothetical protein
MQLIFNYMQHMQLLDPILHQTSCTQLAIASNNMYTNNIYGMDLYFIHMYYFIGVVDATKVQL